ncbi:TetR/AcrR family transcriptional regulator [Nocardia yamanashiensis]|uniref:TetR/AcrR family transcriptional regulator n=1 Tax=Nocardia yamanashiensis TaxID=209247 RepID=UPI000831045B|nr:TetR/AcrR family transcriptional regulator [Nocardia yamanashiensis]
MPADAPLGRGPKVRAAVLAATIDELAEQGYAAFAVENVAKRAGVHKTTVYRRWPERDGLIADALSESVTTDIAIPDTGALEDDLRQLARGLVSWVKSPGGQAVLAVLLSERIGATRPPDAVRHIFRDRIRQALPIVDRAVTRGQLPSGIDPSELVKAVVAPIYFRALITREKLTDATADNAVRLALAGAHSGVFG